jgi:hypothetical protein
MPGQPRPPTVTDTGTTASFTMTINGQGNISTPSPSPVTQLSPFTPLPTAYSSTVYRIAPDGSPDELWSSRDDVVYALGLLPGGKLLLGTGNQGAVLELDGNQIFSRLVQTASRQVTSIAVGPGGKLFLAGANPGKIFTLGPGNEAEGTYESQAFDAHIFSRWGRTEWWGENISGKNAGSTHVEFYARSGNTSDPENNWSAWAGPYSNPSGDKLDCPPARFTQWKAVLHGGANGPVPEIDWVNIAYLPKNIAPEVTAIAVQSPGVRVQGLSIQGQIGGQTQVQVRMPQPPASSSSTNSAFNSSSITNLAIQSAMHFDAVPQGFSQKGYESVLWTADDANDDQLEFSVYFRGENETTWKLLKDKLDSRFYSWDTTTMPDGAYFLKIVASDAPSNPAAEQLTSERESERFVVDNTPPSIAKLTADAGSGAAVRVRFEATDRTSFVARAEYSVDAGDWKLVFPAGGLSDALRESYDFQVPKVGPGEHTVTVRVYDQFDNVSSAESTVRVTSSGN